MHAGDHRVADLFGAVAARQVQQHHEPGAAFDQGADGGGVVRAEDQIAFPVSGHGPIFDLGGPLGDHQCVGDVSPFSAPVRPALGAAQRPPGAQTTSQLAAQLAAALDVKLLVDGFV